MIERIIPQTLGKSLTWDITEIKGKGSSIIKKAALEKGNPAGVKFTNLVMSKGRNTPQKETKDMILITAALIYKEIRRFLIFSGVLRIEAAIK
jgi:hypothetical protein